MPASKTQAAPRLYLKSRITPRWRLEVKSAERSLFFSPYVTGKCAERVLLVAGAGEVELYTVFAAENFASKASSLGCLRNLVVDGVKVFHLEGLHAKMLLVPGKVVTIGSQNLTARGQGNLESTLLVTEKAVIKQAETESEEWIKARVPVTLEMIEDMKKQVRPLCRLFKAAKDAAAALDEQVRARQHERDEVERRARLDQQERERAERRRQELERIRQHQEQVRQRRLHDLSDAVQRMRVASAIVPTRLQTRQEGVFGFVDYTSSPSLMALQQRSLTRWWLDGQTVTLMDYFRYLCIVQETGKLGWARVASSRISFVARSISHGASLFFRGTNWRVTTTGEWKQPQTSGCNLTITLKTLIGQTAELDCWFSVEGLEVIKTTWITERREQFPIDFAEPIANNEDRLRDKLLNFLVEPFKYRDGQKLTGARAGGFFGEIGRRFNVKLAKVGKHEVLIASKVY